VGFVKAREAMRSGNAIHKAYAKYRYGYKPPSPRAAGGLNMYSALCIAIMSTAKSMTVNSSGNRVVRSHAPDDSMPDVVKKPLT
jgi:hypothetical protein